MEEGCAHYMAFAQADHNYIADFRRRGVLGNDFQKIILLYSPETYEVADVIGSYVYRQGILGAQYEYTTAIGMFMSLISFIILYLTNWISRKVSETSLF